MVGGHIIQSLAVLNVVILKSTKEHLIALPVDKK